MKDKICWVRQEDVPKVWIHKDQEYSHRLITKKDQDCSFSFHITTYEPNTPVWRRMAILGSTSIWDAIFG